MKLSVSHQALDQNMQVSRYPGVKGVQVSNVQVSNVQVSTVQVSRYPGVQVSTVQVFNVQVSTVQVSTVQVSRYPGVQVSTAQVPVIAPPVSTSRPGYESVQVPVILLHLHQH